MSRELKEIVVSGGSVYILDTTDGTSALATDGADVLSTNAFGVDSQAFGRKIYYVDGVSYQVLDGDTETVTTWAASAGTLPVDGNSNTASIIGLFQGCIILAGVKDEPGNWFLSALNDPLDFDYSPPTIDETRAVAGNLSDIGLIADRITAIMPSVGDILYMGCDHSIWIFRGHPASGGQLHELTDQTGVVGRDAWCRDPEGNLYFFGAQGVFKMAPLSQPVSMTNNRLDQVIADINLALEANVATGNVGNHINMEWDQDKKGVWVFVTPYAQPLQRQSYFWDARTDSWWRDQYHTSYQPTTTATLDADDPEDRVMLMGNWDSNIRYFKDSSRVDDDYSFPAHCVFPPIQAEEHRDDLVTRRFQFTLGSAPAGTPGWSPATQAMRFEIRSGDDPFEAAGATPRIRGRFGGPGAPRQGRMPLVSRRIAGNAIELKVLKGTGVNDKQMRFMVEDVTMEIVPSGPARRSL